jgi:hypothetical protein
MGIPASFYHAALSQTEKDDLIELFQREDKDDFGNDGIQWLIGTYTVLGIGLNLTRGSRCIIVEPDYTKAAELQALARISRGGQTIPTKGYRLVQTDSLIEKIINEKSQLRDNFIRSALGITADGDVEDQTGLGLDRAITDPAGARAIAEEGQALQTSIVTKISDQKTPAADDSDSDDLYTR